MKKILLLLVFAMAIVSLAQAQTTIYVTTSGDDINNNGMSWGTSFGTVQKALSVAVSGDQIWVATGTYYPDEINATNSGNRDATFQLKNGVALYGGFTVGDVNLSDRDPKPATNETILSGDINQSGNFTGNSYTVVTGSNTNATAVIDGFTITGGNADKSGVAQSDPGRSGGGMYNREGSPTVTNCSFVGNSAQTSGAGMYNVTTASPTVTNCIFAGNSAGLSGGGMFTSFSSPTITNSIFTGNTAGGNGGGMINVASSSPTITNSTFSGNTAANGGGIANFDGGSPTITNTIIWNNAAGGNTALTSASVINTNNPSVSPPNPIFSHSIIANSGGSGSWNTAIGTNGGNNKDVDPLFVAPILTPGLNTGGNYRLRPTTSPAINMGNNAAPGLAGITTDLDLNDRIFFAIVDMGAYEVGCEDFTFTNQVAYVDAAAIAGNKDGSNWANAFTDLQDALSVACNCPGKVTEIWVAEGTYYPSVGVDFDGVNGIEAREATFQLCEGVKLYGGFTSGQMNLTDRDPNPATNGTVLSGDIGTPNNNADNAYHVVYTTGVTAATVLDGFTISAGNANASGGNGNNIRGGGILNFTSSLTIANTIFSGNTAGAGGGMLNFTSSPSITNTTFSGNTAGAGGGMYNTSSDPTITNTTFTGNTANSLGGGMYNTSSDPTITNTTFTGNTANSLGGGMFNAQSDPTITNTTFSGNFAGTGGGMFNDESIPTITNSIIWNNQDNSGIGTASASISIFIGSFPTITYSLVQGITDNSNNNKDGITNAGDANYPQFVTPVDPTTAPTTAGNLRLLPCSPAIDMGDDAAITLTEDLDGNPRKNDADPGGMQVDMGAYEYQGSLFTSNVVFVDADAMGNNDGTTWTDAFNSLQDALNIACACGFDIWVAEGTYYPDEAGGMDTGDRNATFQLCNGVALYGGFSGWSGGASGGSDETMRSERDFVANETILSGDIDKNGLFDNGNAYHVVTGSGTDMTARLDGFSITRGLANGSSFPNNSGGGMFINAGSPAVVNNAFFENSAVINGGNGGNGGGLAIIDFASDPLVLNCRFFANNAQNGGGIYVDKGSITVINSTFASNMAFADGGGMYLDGNFDLNNRPELTNNTFFSNRANQGQGGAMFHDNSNAIIANSIFFGNTAMEGPVFYTFNDNPATETPTISYSLVDVADCAAINVGVGGTCDAGMIFNGDPLFVDGDGADNSVGTTDDDLRLQPTSPAINMGNDAVVPEDAKDVDDDGDTAEKTPDLDLNDRILGAMVDMGAYEVQGGNITVVKTASPTSAGTSFSFMGDLGNFSLDGSNDGMGNENAVTGLPPNSYTITEAALSGWTLTGISISGDTDGGSSIDLDMGTIDVDLDIGEDITITFTNDVIPPSFSKAFAPAVIGSTATSTLTFTIDNSTAPLDATALNFTDNLPNNVVIAATPNASTTCTGGTLTATAGAGTITYTGGTVTAGASCTVSVDVTSSIPGIYANTTSDLTSSLGNSGTATANLTVEPPPVFDKDFSPGTICLGQTSTLTFTIDNTASALAASGLDFMDNLPAGMVVATIPNASTTCTGGTLTANAGSGVISYTGGTVAAGATCTVQVDVTASSFGFLNNSTGNLTSSNGNSGTANASLQVDPQVVINDLSTQTICSTKKQPLSELFNGIIYNGGVPGDLTFEWSIKETDGDNGTLDDLNATNASAGTYTPGAAAIERGFVTLVLTVDNDADACEAVVAEVIITILKVDCGTFPWKGE